MSRFLSKTRRECASERLQSRAQYAVVPAALAIVLGILCAASPAMGALYKWTDANGRVVYSDQPPTGDVKVETIAGPPPPANRNAVKEMANKEAESKKQKIDAADNAKKTAQTRADAEKRIGACKDARAELSTLSSDPVILYKTNEKGEAITMDDAERRRRRETVETYIRTNCSAG